MNFGDAFTAPFVTFAVLLFLLTCIIHVLFAAGVARDAGALRKGARSYHWKVQ